ncbi:MAG: hypothetical protein ACM3S0_16380 [Acidobacteriota bacterium]
MKKAVWAVPLLVLFCVGCAPLAAPAPTSAPAAVTPPTRVSAATSAPQPTAAPKSTTAPATKPTPTVMPPPVALVPTPAIKVQNITPAAGPGGSGRTLAEVNADQYGVGNLEFACPETMLLKRSETVSLRISLSQNLAALTPVPVTSKSPDLPGFIYRPSGTFGVYPVMFARLSGPNFDISPSTDWVRYDLPKSDPAAEWRWVVKPQSEGPQDLLLQIKVPVKSNDIESELIANIPRGQPLRIVVQPRPFWPDMVTDNAGTIIAALIGVIGTIGAAAVAALLKNRSDSTKPTL